MKQKLSIISMVGVCVLVIVTMAFWLGADGDIDISFALMTAGVIAILIATMYMIVDRSKALKEGLPADDEMSKKAGYKAGYFAYIISVWVAVAGLWWEPIAVDGMGLQPIEIGHVVAAVVLIPGICFLLLAIYFRGKGAVE